MPPAWANVAGLRNISRPVTTVFCVSGWIPTDLDPFADRDFPELDAARDDGAGR